MQQVLPNFYQKQYLKIIIWTRQQHYIKTAETWKIVASFKLILVNFISFVLMTSHHNPPTHSIVLQERNERKDGQIQKILLLKLNELLLKLKKWKLNECSLIPKKNWNDGAKNLHTKEQQPQFLLKIR